MVDWHNTEDEEWGHSKEDDDTFSRQVHTVEDDDSDTHCNYFDDAENHVGEESRHLNVAGLNLLNLMAQNALKTFARKAKGGKEPELGSLFP